MINTLEILETNQMIDQEKLDVRTITLGISLLDCIDSDPERLLTRIYDKITHTAENLVKTGNDIEKEFGIPVVNKRISVTPISLVGGAAMKTPEDFEPVCDSFTDDASKEHLIWVDENSEMTYYPTFFREELSNPVNTVKHIVTDNRKL